MKAFLVLLCLIFNFGVLGLAQTIQVSWDKTTVLIFDRPIESVDRGNRFLLTEQDGFALNVLKLKAGSKELPATNLHVMTQDGKIHAFDILYAEDPEVTTWDLRRVQEGKMAIPAHGMDPQEFEELAEYLKNEPSKLIKRQFRYAVHFWLKGIYFQNGLLFFDLGASNTSSLPFQVMGPEAKVIDSKSNRQSSAREQKLKPWMHSNTDKTLLSSGGKQSLLMAFPAFSISNSKRLIFYLREENGDRELQLSLRGKKLLQAIPLPMFHTKPTNNYGSGQL